MWLWFTGNHLLGGGGTLPVPRPNLGPSFENAFSDLKNAFSGPIGALRALRARFFVVVAASRPPHPKGSQNRVFEARNPGFRPLPNFRCGGRFAASERVPKPGFRGRKPRISTPSAVPRTVRIDLRLCPMGVRNGCSGSTKPSHSRAERGRGGYMRCHSQHAISLTTK